MILDTEEAAVRVPCRRCEQIVTLRVRLTALELKGGRARVHGAVTHCEHDVDTDCKGP